MAVAPQSLVWRLKKVARYTRLYGPRKTLGKVQAERHMSRRHRADGVYWVNPGCNNLNHPARTVAIIGCGKFSYSTIAYYLRKFEPLFLAATLDLSIARAASLCEAYGGGYATTDLGRILADPRIDLVYVASNHASHADYAIRCLEAGKAVHIEKPHAVTGDQLARLESAMQRSNRPVFLGYNRPKSSHFRTVLKAISSESGPLMVTWFIAGHEIPEDHWYFAPEEGGRVLGNLCHWLDLSLHLVGAERMFPCTLIPGSPAGARSDFALTIQCADDSLVSISFSAKGHTFEGVREVLNVHRGSSLALLRDFEETRVLQGSRRAVRKTFFRDHGHGENIMNSHIWSRGESMRYKGESLQYVRASGLLALGARVGLDSGGPVKIISTAAGLVLDVGEVGKAAGDRYS